MLNIFIDANIWIPLYAAKKENISEIMKLPPLMGETIKIWLPEQVENEVYRNRDQHLNQNVTSKKESIAPIPQIFQNLEGYSNLVKLKREYEKQYKEIYSQFEEDLVNFSLYSDKILHDIFSACEKIPTTDELVQKAVIRYQLKNPPGKQNSYGDAISWIALLENIPDNEDLHIITKDQDYVSNLNKNDFDSFLRREWVKKKNSEIFLYNDLQNFFQIHLKDIKFKSEAMQITKIKDSLVSELEESGSFSETHYIVGKLSEYDTWTLSQKERILQAAEDNFQMSYIRKDYDISSFLSKVMADTE